MFRSAAGKVMWAGRVSRAPLYALGVIVAVMVALLVGALTATTAQAETLVVDNSTDDPFRPQPHCTDAPNNCTLRAAIAKANTNDQSDTITFAPAISPTMELNNFFFGPVGPLTIVDDLAGHDLTINQPGARVISVDANDASRVFEIASGAGVTINRLTITNGSAEHNDGGGIYNSGTLTLTNSTVSANTASWGSGGIFNNGGGTLTLTNSTVSGNAAVENGGGIGSNGTLTLTNSTVSVNQAGIGGGIYNNGGTLTLANSTVTNNTASDSTISKGGGINNEGGTAILRNTIVAGNNSPTGPDASGSFSSQGTNLIGNTSGSVGFGGSDLLNRSPLLGPLANNGGPTSTHALLSGSPAIDAGTNTLCTSPTDQRGVARRQDGDGNGTQICDIGSFEVANTPPTITNLRPAPGSEIRDRTPLIAATVRDAQTNLAKSNIQLFVDGSKKTTFSYDRIADRLLYTSGQLSFGRHTVKIVATDGVLSTTRSWSFKVVRG